MKKNIRFYSMYSAHTSIIIILFSTVLLGQTSFKYVTNKPVFNYGLAGEWDDGAVWQPATTGFTPDNENDFMKEYLAGELTKVTV